MSEAKRHIWMQAHEAHRRVEDEDAVNNLPYDAVRKSAGVLLNAIPGGWTIDSIPGDDGVRPRFIRREYAEALAQHLHGVIAEVIASLLDAGSERDAVLENDTLRDQLIEEIWGWTDAPENAPKGGK